MAYEPNLQDEASNLVTEAYKDHSPLGKLGVEGPRKSVSFAVWIGIALICVEVISLGVLQTTQSRQLSSRRPQPNPLLHRNDCRGEIYRTYRKIVAYMEDHDRQPPDTLQDLVGRYSDIPPADPVTGKPLVYAKQGAKLVLRCQ